MFYMALINCPECGKDISTQATTCPHCGITLRSSTTKKKKSKIPTIIILLFIFSAVIVVLIKQAPSTTTNNTASTSTDPSTTASPSDTTSKDESIPLGTATSIGDFSIMVNSVTEATEISAGSGFLKYTADSGKYGIVNVTLKNTSQSSSTFSLSSFQLVSSDGVEYSPTIIAAADENYISIDSLNPNMDTTGNIAFNIPSDVDTTSLTLTYSAGFSGSTVFELK